MTPFTAPCFLLLLVACGMGVATSQQPWFQATLSHMELGMSGDEPQHAVAEKVLHYFHQAMHPSKQHEEEEEKEAEHEKDKLQQPNTESDAATSATESSQCSLYLAPSSLKGSDGLGVYTARDYKWNEAFLQGPDGPSIAVIDPHHHFTGSSNDTPLRQARNAWLQLFDQYWWGHGVNDQVRLEGHAVVMDFQIMFGSLPNHHCILNAITFGWPRPPYDEQGLNRSNDPGAGAFSYHRGRNFQAGRFMRAGEGAYGRFVGLFHMCV